MVQYKIAHRMTVEAASELLTVDAQTSSAAITAARSQLPEGHTILFVRPLSADLRG